LSLCHHQQLLLTMATTATTATTSSEQQQQSAKSLVLRTLSILLGIFFIFLGLVKCSPLISKDLHKDMRKEFVRYSKVFPLCETLGFKVPSKWYRRAVGAIEVAAGILLAAVPSAHLKRLSNGVLFLVSLLSVYSHLLTDDKFERTAPALVFLFMLVCRLVVDLQADKKLAQFISKHRLQRQQRLQSATTTSTTAAAQDEMNNVDNHHVKHD